MILLHDKQTPKYATYKFDYIIKLSIVNSRLPLLALQVIPLNSNVCGAIVPSSHIPMLNDIGISEMSFENLIVGFFARLDNHTSNLLLPSKSSSLLPQQVYVPLINIG
jgi:hypothetical protein